MLQRNLLHAFRSLKFSKGNTFINVCGLGIAAAAFLLLLHYIRFERSYESFHSKADRIARLTIDLYNGPEIIGTDCETYPPLGPALKKEFPEVVDFVRLQDYSPVEVKETNQVFALEKLYATDPSIFSVFDYQLIEGDARTALSAPMQAVVSATMAKRLFGNEKAIGKVIKVNTHPMVITGVLEDVPLNTHLRFDLLVSFNSVPTIGGDTSTWQGNNNFTYLLLKKETDLQSLNNKLGLFAKARLKHENLVAQGISDIHLFSNRAFEPDINGDIKTVNFLTVVAMLIVVIGCINYVNLVTANASDRAKAAGMRKLLGSSKSSLIQQYLGETFIVNILAFLFALLLIEIAYPYYLTLTGRSFRQHIFLESSFWWAFSTLFLVNALLSGLYPAFVLSSIKPTAVIRRSFTQSVTGTWMRKGLVVGQFTVSIVVLIASVVVYRQVTFMRNQDKGMNASELLVLKGPMNSEPDSVHMQKVQNFKTRLLHIGAVSMVSSSGAVPGENINQLNTTTGIVQLGTNLESGLNYCNYDIDENFIPSMQIKLAAGRNFRAGNQRNEVLLNMEASRLLGYASPEQAIGGKITYGGRGVKFSTVVGVIMDYKQGSVKNAMLPIIHTYSQANDSYYSLKINTKNIEQTIAGIQSIWKSTFPENSFQYFFLDELIDRQYRSDLRFGQIISIFSALTFFITCLGILGLTAATISKRTREIGIRKVLGASVQSIVSLISGDFVKLVCIAILIASPVAWLLMNEWLKDYNTRINIGLWVFIASGLLALSVAIITISYQAIKAATANPVNSLKAD
ncbi:ABC transporter permease [Flavitalea antarctica]